jgi:hypothetical protein
VHAVKVDVCQGMIEGCLGHELVQVEAEIEKQTAASTRNSTLTIVGISVFFAIHNVFEVRNHFPVRFSADPSCSLCTGRSTAIVK